jgi:hypothetical protein
MTIPPLSVAYLKAYICTKGGMLPSKCNLGIASNHHPLVTRGPYLVEPNNLGQVTIAMKNCSPIGLELTILSAASKHSELQGQRVGPGLPASNGYPKSGPPADTKTNSAKKTIY